MSNSDTKFHITAQTVFRNKYINAKSFDNTRIPL